MQQAARRHREHVAGVTEVGKFTTRLLSIFRLSADTVQLDLERPGSFWFVPGQGIRLRRGDLEREYTIVSGPADPRLTLCVQVVERGPFSPALATLEVGSILSFSGPHGYFTFQSAARPAVFVATGTGIAPFVSMVRSGVSGFTLLHGAATVRDLHYREVLQPAALRYVGCVSREAPGPSSPPWMHRGRVTDFLRADLSPGELDFYLCGRREMVRDVTSIVDERFPGSRVFFEVFF